MPKNIPLRYPPGVMRNGTKYQAQGRWYDAQLVRWYEGVMRPFDGWQRKNHTDTKAVSAAIADDGGAFTDETTDANSATANDVQLLPVSPAVNDAFYVGYTHVFSEVQVNVGTVATDGAVIWEYYNGSAWVALSGVVDLTNGFRVSGTKAVTFPAPRDWVKTTVNAQGPFYYVRARVSTAGTSQALGTQLWIATAPIQLDEAVRSLIAWRDNAGKSRLAMGTASYAYTFVEGVLVNITPAGFTAGQQHASTASGAYGQGAYGSGVYGVGDPSLSTITEANTWTLDSWGEYLVGCAYSDGKLYVWDLNPSNDFTVVHADAPTGCVGLVVTPERFLVALGATGTPGSWVNDKRALAWCDQENYAVWTPSTLNQAGDWVLATRGELLNGKSGRNETLLWTTTDLWAMRYVGGTLVYAFQRVGSECGAISRHAMVVIDGQAYWMGHRGFFNYNGFTEPIPCEVSDYVYGDLNRTQSSKITCHTISEFGEIIWYYPSAASTKNDRYVIYNYREKHWTFGSLERTAGADRGPYPYYVSADEDGSLYDHEIGALFLDPDGNALVPSAEGGPLEIGHGDQVMDVVEMIPDDKTLGDVQATFFYSFYPDQSESSSGPHTLSERTDLRFSGRQVRLKVIQVNPAWRVGVPRIAVEVGGRR